MDHVSANKSLSVTERENISGARVFDGEDQGKIHNEYIYELTGLVLMNGVMRFKLNVFKYRFRKQIQNARVTIERLV